MALATEVADFQKMNQVRARVDQVVRDRTTAEALKPWYRQFCKRPCFHDEYLDTFNRPGVHLVDTRGRGVERMTPRGVVANGVEIELDCLVFATGFEVGTGYTRRAGYEITGRGGVKLSEKWAEGPSTYHGLHSRGFPNCYFMGFIQTALAPNFTHLLDEQATHLAYIVAEARRRGARTVEAAPAAEAGWVAMIHGGAAAAEQFYAQCTPGYYNNEGKPGANRNAFFANLYLPGPVAFFNLLREWRAAGALEGLELN